MAIGAPLVHRAVSELYLGEGISHLLVAVKTEGIPRFHQIKLIIRGVWVVAFNAIPFQGDFVSAPRILRHHRLMAFAADFVCFL